MKHLTSSVLFLLALLLLVGCSAKDPQFYLQKLLDANIEKDFDAFVRYNLMWQNELSENPQKLEMYKKNFERSCKGKITVNSVEQIGEPSIEEEKEDGEVFRIETVKFKVVIDRDEKTETSNITMLKVTSQLKKKMPGLKSKAGEWGAVK